MKRLVAFCLTSNGVDQYARMQRLACDSLRFSDPDCSISLVLDHESLEAIRKSSPELLYQFDRLWPTKTPAGSPSWVNRWLKTGLRNIVEGDVLYLDADLVVRGALSDIWRTNCDVGGVLNGNTGKPFFSKWDRRQYEALGWELPAHGSVNGGVIFWRETEGAYRVAERYRTRWLESSEKTGRHNDQPALNRALEDAGAEIGILDDRFNAMETYHPGNLRNARIWHFMNSGGAGRPVTRWHEAVFSDSPVPPASAWAQWKHPWILRDPVARFALSSMMKEDRVSFKGDWRRHWIRGERKDALRKLLSRFKSVATKSRQK